MYLSKVPLDAPGVRIKALSQLIHDPAAALPECECQLDAHQGVHRFVVLPPELKSPLANRVDGLRIWIRFQGLDDPNIVADAAVARSSRTTSAISRVPIRLRSTY